MSDDFETLGHLLRMLILIGSIGSVGAVFYSLSMKSTTLSVRKVLFWQLGIGVTIIIFVEPLRYWLFLMSITGNDMDLAMSKDILIMGIKAPPGQAALIRLAGALSLTVFGLRNRFFGLTGAVLILVSYGFEGHIAASENRPLMTLLLLFHISIAHWWFGALVPLIAETHTSSNTSLAKIAERFGFIATILVPLLLIAGGLMFAEITERQLNLTNDYQWRAALKIALVIVLLSLAAVNKFLLTPELRSRGISSAKRLRSSIYIEVIIALGVLTLTSYLTATSPDF